MTKALGIYGRLHPSVFLLFVAELLLNALQAAFVLILNLYLRKLGYDDSQIAAWVSYRYLGALLLSLPLGFWLRGRRVKPWLLASVVGLPLFSFTQLEALRLGLPGAVELSILLWGLSYGILQVVALPYLLRLVNHRWHSEAIALHYSNAFAGFIVAGAVIYGVPLESFRALPGGETGLLELPILRMFTLLSLVALPLMALLAEGTPTARESRVSLNSALWQQLKTAYDWQPLLKALIPTTIIAVGAGLTFPFVNLFFYQVFQVDSTQFGLLGAVSSALVVVGALLVPALKRRYGYRIVITLSQTLAVVFLVILGLTQLAQPAAWALPLAIATYLIRQPLMNIAAPMTSELTLLYAGERNREMVGALTSSIWSGSWFLSARIFQGMRAGELDYWQVFLITAAFYAIGVYAYYRMIVSHERRAQPAH